METIAFFSYKGGTGKSYAVANLAVILSRLGKTVAIVDTDVDGPGLHYKFGEQGIAAAGKGGLVKLLETYVSQPQEGGALHFDHFPTEPNPVETFVSQVQPHDESFGVIHLLPAGDIHSRDYWRFLQQPVWWKLFSFRTAAGKPLDRLPAMRSLEFILSIKARLQSLSPVPDYLLLDLRGGIADVNTILVQYWADKVACMFLSNRENIDCLKYTLPRLRAIKRGVPAVPHNQINHQLTEVIPPLPLDIVPILSRTPPNAQEKRGQRTLQRVYQELQLESAELYLLHSDRELEMWEELQFGFYATPANRLLAQEYISLLARLMRHNHEASDDQEAIAEIRHALQLDAPLLEEERLFTIHRSTGALFNPTDASRNVSFKVDTFNSLLDGISTALTGSFRGTRTDSDTTAGSADPINAFRTALHSAGESSGQAFGLAFRQDIWEHAIPVEGHEVELVRTWCSFDSNVGFGYFQLLQESLLQGHLTAGVIELADSFLSEGDRNSPSQHSRCSLMTGYIAGVLASLLRRRFHVHHEISEQGDCQFAFAAT